MHRRCILLVLILALQIACASAPGPVDEPLGDSAELVRVLENTNQTLTTAKGIGRLEFTHSGSRQRLRVAWVSQMPDKIRLTILGLDGRPLMTAAADEIGFTLQDHTTGTYQTGALEDFRFKAALHLPLDVNSLILILAGRLPDFEYDRAEIAAGRSDGEDALVLKKWWNSVGRIYYRKAVTAGSRPVITRIEAFRQTGETRYRADIKATRVVGNYVVPRTLAIQSASADRIVLNIERYWVNAPVAPETFQLKRPE